MPLHTRSIRATLVLVALLAALPPFGVILFDNHRFGMQLQAESEASVTRAASSIAELQARVTESVHQTLVTLATMPDVRSLDPQACKRIFEALLPENSALLNLVAIDANGNLVASARQILTDTSSPQGFNFADRQYFRFAMRDKRFSSGEYVMARTLREATFHFALPLLDDKGRPYAVLAAPIRLDRYDQLFDRLQLPPGSVLSLSDQRGMRLSYHPKSTTDPVGSPMRPEVWEAMRTQGNQGLVTHEGTDNVRRLYAFSRLQLYPETAPYMSVVVGIPESAVLAPVQAAQLHALLMFGACITVTLAVAWLAGGRLVAQPLARIAETATSIGNGQFDARTGINHFRGEIGQLARCVDSMAAMLAQREQERQEFTAALQDNEARYHAVFDEAMDAILLADADTGVIIDANNAALQTFGYTKEEIPGLHQRALHPERMHREGFGGRFATLRDHPIDLPLEMPMRTKAGVERDMLVKAKVLQVGQRSVVVGLFHDITERKQSALQLREIEMRFRSIVEGAPFGVLLLTPNRAEHLCIETVNPTADAALRITARGMLGQRLTDALPAISSTNLPAIFSSIAAKGGTFSVTAHSSADWLPAGWPFVDLWAFRTSNRQVAVLFADVSGRAHADAELHRAKDAAERANLSKSESIAIMSHEVRTPINGIMGMLQLLHGTSLSREQADCVETALGAGRNLLRILEDILDIARMEAGALALESEAFAMTDVTAPVYGLMLPQAREKGLTLRMETDPALPAVLGGDSGRIRQVLVNLVSNAVRYTDTGEVRVQVYPLPRCGRKDRISIHFAISDTGAGIHEDMLRTLFDSYSTGKPHPSTASGTGLGLAIVRQLVQLMNGALCVASEPGEGTDIHLTLPLRVEEELPVTTSGGAHPPGMPPREPFVTPAAQGPSAARPAEPSPGQESRHESGQESARKTTQEAVAHILVVDDDDVSRLTAQRLLIRLGYTVDSASSGAQALAMLDSARYDALLMDIQMPHMDGMETTRRIRLRQAVSGTGTPPDVPVVALTAHAMRGDRERFLKGSMNEYLAKPVDAEVLDTILRSVLAAAAGIGQPRP